MGDAVTDAGRPRGRPWPVLAVAAALVAVNAAILAIPFVMIEPDDYDYYFGMLAFSRGWIVLDDAQCDALRWEGIERFGRDAQVAGGVPTPRGWIRERSPGHYALLAGLHRAGLDRFVNVLLSVPLVLGLFLLVRRAFRDEGLAVAVSLLAIFNPTFLTALYRPYMSDLGYAAFAFFALAAYLWARSRGGWARYALAGLLFSLSVIYRYTNGIALVAMALYELLNLLRRKGASAPPPLRFAHLAGLAAGAVIGIAPLAWYTYETTGKLFGIGYDFRLSHQGHTYFALWEPRALFSLYHLGYTLSVGLTRLLQGYPILFLAPAGLLLLSRDRLRTRGFLTLWLLAFGGLYITYGIIREDNFQFMCRKFLPWLPPLAVGAAGALWALPRRARWVAVAAIAAVGMGVSAEFFARFAREGRRMPPPEDPQRLLAAAERRIDWRPVDSIPPLIRTAEVLSAAPDEEKAKIPELRRLVERLRPYAKRRETMPAEEAKAIREQIRELADAIHWRPPPPARRRPRFPGWGGPGRPPPPAGFRGPEPPFGSRGPGGPGRRIGPDMPVRRMGPRAPRGRGGPLRPGGRRDPRRPEGRRRPADGMESESREEQP